MDFVVTVPSHKRKLEYDFISKEAAMTFIFGFFSMLFLSLVWTGRLCVAEYCGLQAVFSLVFLIPFKQRHSFLINPFFVVLLPFESKVRQKLMSLLLGQFLGTLGVYWVMESFWSQRIQPIKVDLNGKETDVNHLYYLLKFVKTLLLSVAVSLCYISLNWNVKICKVNANYLLLIVSVALSYCFCWDENVMLLTPLLSSLLMTGNRDSSIRITVFLLGNLCGVFIVRMFLKFVSLFPKIQDLHEGALASETDSDS